MVNKGNGKKVLIIEDEVKLARFVELELTYEGYQVIVSNDGREGLELFYKIKPDIILLDLMLPNLTGIEICRRIRKTSSVPIVILTAKGDVIDKVLGLDSGADDYVTKPFAIEEVLARVRVAIKRNEANSKSSNIIKIGDIVIDKSKRTVKVNDELVELTKREYELLIYLILNKNVVTTRDQILDEVWGYNYVGETNVVDVYIRYLRTKIDDKYNIKLIHTIRGVGYFVKDED